MPDSQSETAAAKAMRRKAQLRLQQGMTRNTLWLSPTSVEILDKLRDGMNLKSREAALNAFLERVNEDMYLRQEVLAVTK